MANVALKKPLNASLDGFSGCFFCCRNFFRGNFSKNWGNFITTFWQHIDNERNGQSQYETDDTCLPLIDLRLGVIHYNA